ncbi:MAG: sigma-70 family RNA polymerase sigma factor [Firmicutes bacterium]|jgi:RNA polymerase sigma-70 factor (ECF subfamily)|nr:sigma-70 family RNA polymerase sigma factor [Bacillota bacterium]
MGTCSQDVEGLIAQCAEGEALAWQELVSSYAPYVYCIITHLFGSAGESADDIFQAVFTKLYLNLDKFDGRSSFRTWFTTLVRNVCIDYMRSHRAITARESLSPLPDGADTLSEETLYDQEIAALAESLDLKLAMAELPPEARRLLYLRFYRDLSYSEIARLTGRPENSISVMVARTLARLRRILSRDPETQQGGCSS